MRRLIGLIGLLAVVGGAAEAHAQELRGGAKRKVMIVSSKDGTPQPCYLIVPEKPLRNERGETPLLVALHSWSADLEQKRPEQEQACIDQGWIYLYPNFRGANIRPEACGSELAQQDILDAVAWARKSHQVDARRIYLTGVSGGGHMTMLMAGRHPELWAAASAWAGISDLAAWHDRHRDTRYGKMMRASCGGAPGDSPEVDRQYRARSPLTHLGAAKQVPLEIATGIHDGHTGSVPIRHALAAFNAIAAARGDTVIGEAEIQQLSRRNGRLADPQPSDQVTDATYGRAIHLRRHAGPARVTIFEGGHEGIVKAAIAWLAKHQKE